MKGRTPIFAFDSGFRGSSHIRCRLAAASGYGSRGFSLLELLIALALLIGVLALIPARFSGGVTSAGLRTTTAQTAAGLRLTRSRAISGNRDRRFELDLANRRFLAAGGERAITLDPAVTVKMTTAESERVDADHAFIRFFPDGSSTGGRIELSRGDGGFLIAVDWLSGRITVSRISGR